MNEDDNWNEAEVSRLFLNRAENANTYLSEVRYKVKSNSSYERVYDEHLAEYYVFNYLHGRTFLASRKWLLQELKKMIDYNVKPTDAYDRERFEMYRKSYVNEIIKQYGDGEE